MLQNLIILKDVHVKVRGNTQVKKHQVEVRVCFSGFHSCPLRNNQSDFFFFKVFPSLSMVSYYIQNKFKLDSHPCSGPCLSLWPLLLRLSLPCLFPSQMGCLQSFHTNFPLPEMLFPPIPTQLDHSQDSGPSSNVAFSEGFFLAPTLNWPLPCHSIISLSFLGGNQSGR